MRVVEGLGNFNAVADHLVNREAALAQSFCQRDAVTELHHENVDTRLVPDVVQRADVRMVQARDRPGFPFEPLAKLGARFEGRQDLEGNGPVQARVARPIDLSHATRSKRGQNVERTEKGSWIEHFLNGDRALIVLYEHTPEKDQWRRVPWNERHTLRP